MEPVIKSPVDMNLGPAMGTTARMVPSTSPRHPAIKTPTIDTAGEQKPRASKKKAAPQKTSLGAYVVGGVINNGKLFIEMQGPTPMSLQTLEAKTLAYNARYGYGFANSGIESYGTPYPCTKSGKSYTPGAGDVDHYRCVFRLTPG